MHAATNLSETAGISPAVCKIFHLAIKVLWPLNPAQSPGTPVMLMGLLSYSLLWDLQVSVVSKPLWHMEEPGGPNNR